MTPKARNRIVLIGALAVAFGALGFVAFGDLGQNLVYYWSPGEMLSKGDVAYGKTVRLGGVVRPGSIVWDESRTHLEFKVADDHKLDSKTVLVRATETPPQMFREGIGVVVEGTYAESGVFTSNRLMVNHSNEYRAPKEGEKPDEWKKSLDQGETQARAK